MTGYIKAFKPELKIKDYELYKGVYCSECRVLGKLYTPIARMLLSYDFTFLSIVRLALREKCSKFENGRCCPRRSASSAPRMRSLSAARMWL